MKIEVKAWGLEVERDALQSQLTATTADLDKAVKTLEWYAEQAAGCRKLGSIGDPFRQALDRDGGNLARSTLSEIKNKSSHVTVSNDPKLLLSRP